MRSGNTRGKSAVSLGPVFQRGFTRDGSEGCQPPYIV